MPSLDIKEIYDNNPSTSLPDDSLMYAGLSPFGVTGDTAQKISDFKSQFGLTSFLKSIGNQTTATGNINLAGLFNGALSSNVASASTTNLETATGNFVNITGTNTINTVTLSAGHQRLVRFVDGATLTNSGTLVLPGEADIMTSAGDMALLVGGSGVVYVALYQRIDGKSLTGGNIFQAVYATLPTDIIGAIYDNQDAGKGATLTAPGVGAFSADGHSPSLGDTIVVPETNIIGGLYTLTTVGDGSTAWQLTRSVYYNQPNQIHRGDLFQIKSGNTFAEMMFYLVSDVQFIGINNFDFNAIAIMGLVNFGNFEISGAFNGHQADDIASSGTINLNNANGNLVDVTGNTTITAITLSQGRSRLVRFTGALVLTNSSSLVLPTGANITTAAGDYALFEGYAGGVVRLAIYQRKDGTALVGNAGTVTSVSVTTQNGVSAVVSNPTTTPALAFTLGDITPNTVVARPSAGGAVFRAGTQNDTPVYCGFDNNSNNLSGYIGIENSTGAGALGTPGAYSLSLSTLANGTGQLGFGTQQVLAGMIDTSQRWLMGYTSNQTGDKLQVNGGISAIFNGSQGSNISSASTINLETATGNIVDVTGTTTITAATLSQGHERLVRFTGSLVLTNGSSLVLPSGANITTAAGDYAKFAGYSGGVVRVTEYTRANGTALVSSVAPWNVIAGTSADMLPNNNYIALIDETTTFALPLTFNPGDSIYVAFGPHNDPNFIAQQDGQTMTMFGFTTDVGTGHGITASFTCSLILLVATSSTNMNCFPLNGSWMNY